MPSTLDEEKEKERRRKISEAFKRKIERRPRYKNERSFLNKRGKDGRRLNWSFEKVRQHIEKWIPYDEMYGTLKSYYLWHEIRTRTHRKTALPKRLERTFYDEYRKYGHDQFEQLLFNKDKRVEFFIRHYELPITLEQFRSNNRLKKYLDYCMIARLSQKYKIKPEMVEYILKHAKTRKQELELGLISPADLEIVARVLKRLQVEEYLDISSFKENNKIIKEKLFEVLKSPEAQNKVRKGVKKIIENAFGKTVAERLFWKQVAKEVTVSDKVVEAVVKQKPIKELLPQSKRALEAKKRRRERLRRRSKFAKEFRQQTNVKRNTVTYMIFLIGHRDDLPSNVTYIKLYPTVRDMYYDIIEKKIAVKHVSVFHGNLEVGRGIEIYQSIETKFGGQKFDNDFWMLDNPNLLVEHLSMLSYPFTHWWETHVAEIYKAPHLYGFENREEYRTITQALRLREK